MHLFHKKIGNYVIKLCNEIYVPKNDLQINQIVSLFMIFCVCVCVWKITTTTTNYNINNKAFQDSFEIVNSKQISFT